MGAAIVVGRRELRALVKVTPRPLGEDEPLLVVIPARNEAARITPGLDALLADPSPGLSVVVVDDRSTDDTAAVVERIAARDARVRVLRLVDDPSPGVFGKPRALAAAVDDARARNPLPPRVLFLDADMTLARGALGGLVDAFTSSGAHALSGVPRLVTATAVEDMLVPALVSVVTARTTPGRVHDAKDRTAFLNGQLLLVDTAALDDVGGWTAVSHTVLEDVALARLLKAKGHALRLADLRALASTRMYESFGEIVSGFGKNATALLGRSAGAVGVFSFVASLLPAASLVTALLSESAWTVYASTVLVATITALQLQARKDAGAPLWPVLVLPLAYLGVAYVLVRASLRALLGRPLAWRGREYPPR